PCWRSFAAMVRAVRSIGEGSFILKVGAVHPNRRFIFVCGRLRSIGPTFGRGQRPLPQGMNDEEDHCDANAGIGDVEGWPWVGEANMQIEEKKIGDVTVGEPVSEVAYDAGEK